MNASVVVVTPKNVASSTAGTSRIQQQQQQQQQPQCRKSSYGQLALNSILANNNNVVPMDGKHKLVLRQTTNGERGRLYPKKSHSTTDLSQLKSKSSSSSSSNRCVSGGGSGNASSSTTTNGAVHSSPMHSGGQLQHQQVQHRQSTATNFSNGGTVGVDFNSMTGFVLPGNGESSVLQQPFIKKTNQERRFRRLFRSVPTTETLLSRFSCAFVSDLGLLLQGHLYVSYGWICFHSNIFGIEKIIEISVDSISSVCKTRTAKIIPNAVCVRTKHGKQYVFGSLLSRDNTHQLLVSVVSKPQTPSSLIVNGENAFRPSTDSVNPGASGSSPGSPVDDNLSMSSCSSGGEDSSDEASSTLADGPSGDNNHQHRMLNNKKSAAKVDLTKAGIQVSTSSFSSKLSIQGLVTWFLSLPKIMMALIICVALLSFLFMCATCLTVRLMYLHNPQSTLSDLILSTMRDNRKPLWTLDSFDRMNTVIDATLRLIVEVKRQLEVLKEDVFTETSVNYGSSEAVVTASSTNYVHNSKAETV